MQRSHLVLVLAPLGAAVLLAATSGVRKDPNGVYGIIDSVRFEPTSETAERVQLWGVFAMVDVTGIENDKVAYVHFGAFKPAQRGYLYYTVNRRDEAMTRSEWVAMKTFAGTRQPVAFGGAIPPGTSAGRNVAIARRIMSYNGRVRSAGEPPAVPDTFPLRMAGVPVQMRVDSARVARFGLYDVP